MKENEDRFSSPVEDDVVSVGVEPEQMDKQSSSRIKTLPLCSSSFSFPVS